MLAVYVRKKQIVTITHCSLIPFQKTMYRGQSCRCGGSRVVDLSFNGENLTQQSECETHPYKLILAMPLVLTLQINIQVFAQMP